MSSGTHFSHSVFGLQRSRLPSLTVRANCCDRPPQADLQRLLTEDREGVPGVEKGNGLHGRKKKPDRMKGSVMKGIRPFFEREIRHEGVVSHGFSLE